MVTWIASLHILINRIVVFLQTNNNIFLDSPIFPSNVQTTLFASYPNSTRICSVPYRFWPNISTWSTIWCPFSPTMVNCLLLWGRLRLHWKAGNFSSRHGTYPNFFKYLWGKCAKISTTVLEAFITFLLLRTFLTKTKNWIQRLTIHWKLRMNSIHNYHHGWFENCMIFIGLTLNSLETLKEPRKYIA